MSLRAENAHAEHAHNTATRLRRSLAYENTRLASIARLAPATPRTFEIEYLKLDDSSQER